jgi:hypothetical protein
MKALILSSAILAVVATEAAAQKIDPRCTRMRDPVGCTCALENGGYITTQGNWTANKPGRGGTDAGRHLNEAFYQCNMRRKGRNG